MSLLLGVALPRHGQAQSSGEPAPAQRGRDSGAPVTVIVREAGSGEPVEGAQVHLVGTRLGGATTRDGRLTLPNAPTGDYVLQLRRIGYAPVERRVTVLAGYPIDVTVELQRAPIPLAEVVVTPGHFGLMETGLAAAQTLTREEIETVPQIGDDIFRAVARLPGVSASDLSAAFRVRGGEHRELLVRLDGLELYEPFHIKDFDGALSIIDVGAIGGIDLNTGGFAAEFGDRLVGVFDMRTAEVDRGRPRTALGFTLTNLRAMSQGSFGGDRGRWLVSARRGYLDLAFKLARERRDISPRYYDALGKVEYRLTAGHALSLHFLHAGDELDFRDHPADPTLRSAYRSSYAWANWRARLSPTLSLRTVLSAGRLRWQRLGTHFSEIDGQLDLDLHDDRELLFGGVRQEWSAELSSRSLLRWGFEARRLAAQYDYITWERGTVFRRGRLSTYGYWTGVRAEPDGWIAGAYGAYRLRPWEPITAEVGLRYDEQPHSGHAAFSPRVSAAWTIGRSTLRAAWGFYSQAQGFHEVAVQDFVDRFHPAERAEHRVVGFEHLLGGGITLRAEAYERLVSQPRPRYVNLANDVSDVFPELAPDRRRVFPTSARARGVELFAKRDGGRADWAASYAIATSRERIEGLTVPRSFDQRHTLYLDVSYRPNTKWRFSAAFQYHSGWPTTPVTFDVDTLANGQLSVQGIYGARNSGRLPSYHRLDARVTRHFTVGRGRISVFVDLFNVYDRTNPRDYSYDVEFSPNGRNVTVLRSIDPMFPRLPSFGVSWEF